MRPSTYFNLLGNDKHIKNGSTRWLITQILIVILLVLLIHQTISLLATLKIYNETTVQFATQINQSSAPIATSQDRKSLPRYRGSILPFYSLECKDSECACHFAKFPPFPPRLFNYETLVGTLTAPIRDPFKSVSASPIGKRRGRHHHKVSLVSQVSVP
jgi:hypothetical protein